MTSLSPPTIDHLLNLVPDQPTTVLTLLAQHPDLAPQQDAHGYGLLHAAASYGHPELLTALVREYGVDPNALDEDGETALFAVEDAGVAARLLALGTEPERRNGDGVTAAEKCAAEDEFPAVVAFFRSRGLGGGGEGEGGNPGGDGANGIPDGEGEGDGDGEGLGRAVHAPPPLPDGIRINVGTMSDADAGGEPEPEFRRRIEELAARGDFEGEEGQRELRRLVEEAVTGISSSSDGPGPATRRRMG